VPISGTILNIVTVLVGGVLGLLVGGRLPERFSSIILGGLGLSTLVVGMQNALVTQNILILIGSVLLGGLLGELLRLQDGLDNLGTYLKGKLARGGGRGSATFTEAFVTSSIVFCVGPLTILGSIQNGISGGAEMNLLAIKSLLDGFAAFAFAATLGWGVLVSTATILIYQSALSLSAWLIATGIPERDNPYILELTAAGGLIILGVGLKLLNLKEMKLANYLPALAIAPLMVWILSFFG
jgi:uncharacterized protein